MEQYVDCFCAQFLEILEQFGPAALAAGLAATAVRREATSMDSMFDAGSQSEASGEGARLWKGAEENVGDRENELQLSYSLIAMSQST